MTAGVARCLRLSIVLRPAEHLWRMRADRFLVGFGSPARRVGNDQGAVMLTPNASAPAAIFIACQPRFHTASMIATSIACSRKYGTNWRSPSRVSHELGPRMGKRSGLWLSI